MKEIYKDDSSISVMKQTLHKSLMNKKGRSNNWYKWNTAELFPKTMGQIFLKNSSKAEQ